MSHHLRFSFDRALQASACLLRLDHKRMSYLRLLKLLYIADREWFAESGESITGDRVVAMRNGPVLSNVYDLIRGEASDSGRWDDYIHRDGYRVTLVKEPGRGDLSRGIVDKLTEVTARHREDSDWDIVAATHHLPEWEKNWKEDTTSKSQLIPWKDILEAQGKAGMIASVERDLDASRSFEEAFGCEP